MSRLKTAVMATMTVLLVTSAVAGAVSTGTVTEAVASATDTEHSTTTDGDATGTADASGTSDATGTVDAPGSNVSAAQVEAALGPFLDALDVTQRQRAAVLDRAESLRADGAAPARIVHATYAELHEQGVPRAELRESTWRLRVGVLLAQLDLTADQRAAVVGEVEAKRADDADAREIRRAAGGTLLEYGVERDEIARAWRNVRHVELHIRLYRLEQRLERFHDRARDGGHDHPDGKPAWAHRVQHRYDLTDERTREVVEEARAMHEAGADREAILEMVHRKLHEFGADHRHGDPFEHHQDGSGADGGTETGS